VARKRKLAFNEYGFKSVFLGDEQRVHFAEWAKDRSETPLDSLRSLADSNIKASISYDYKQDAYQISLTFRNEKLPCFGTVYMIRHRDMNRLIGLAWFYVSEYLDMGNLGDEPEDHLDF